MEYISVLEASYLHVFNNTNVLLGMIKTGLKFLAQFSD